MAGFWQALLARVVLRSNCEARSVLFPSSALSGLADNVHYVK